MDKDTLSSGRTGQKNKHSSQVVAKKFKQAQRIHRTKSRNYKKQKHRKKAFLRQTNSGLSWSGGSCQDYFDYNEYYNYNHSYRQRRNDHDRKKFSIATNNDIDKILNTSTCIFSASRPTKKKCSLKIVVKCISKTTNTDYCLIIPNEEYAHLNIWKERRNFKTSIEFKKKKLDSNDCDYMRYLSVNSSHVKTWCNYFERCDFGIEKEIQDCSKHKHSSYMNNICQDLVGYYISLYLRQDYYKYGCDDYICQYEYEYEQPRATLNNLFKHKYKYTMSCYDIDDINHQIIDWLCQTSVELGSEKLENDYLAYSSVILEYLFESDDIYDDINTSVNTKNKCEAGKNNSRCWIELNINFTLNGQLWSVIKHYEWMEDFYRNDKNKNSLLEINIAHPYWTVESAHNDFEHLRMKWMKHCFDNKLNNKENKQWPQMFESIKKLKKSLHYIRSNDMNGNCQTKMVIIGQTDNTININKKESFDQSRIQICNACCRYGFPDCIAAKFHDIL